VGLAAAGEIGEFISRCWALIVSCRPGRSWDFGEKVILLLGGVVLLLAVFQVLTPPSDYDALMYHLYAPVQFLREGRLFPMPENIQANYPFTVDMLFTIGLALGSDVVAKLIHFGFALLLVVSTYVVGRRYLSPKGGMIAVALLIGTPILPLWSTMAQVDLTWAVPSINHNPWSPQRVGRSP
jgi:hypothetical protein